MSVAPERHTGGDVEVVKLSRTEYQAAKRRALRSVGLTYRQLAAQARRRQFSSLRARKVWVAIGGKGR